MQLDIRGAGGGSSSSGRSPVEADDTLRSREWANIIDLLGEGEIEGLVGMDGVGTIAEQRERAEQSILFDGVPLRNSSGVANFDLSGVTWTFVPGTQDQPVLPTGGAVASEVDVGQEVKAGTVGGGPVVRHVSESYIDAVRINLSVPRLTSQNSSNGDTNGSKVEFAVDIQSNGGGFIQKMIGVIEGKTSSEYKRSYELPLEGDGPWDIRIRRITPDSTSNTEQNQLYWSTLTKIVKDKLSYPNTALVGLRVDSSLFSRVPARAYMVKLLKVKIPKGYNPVTREYPDFWDGTFDYAWTDNPAWCWYDLATSDRYGLGAYIEASQVDKWTLYEIAKYCDELVPDGRGGMEPRFTCNLIIQTREEAIKVLMNMASIFRGIAYWSGSSIMCAQDRPSDPVKIFNQSNVVDGQFTYSGTARQARHTVALVTYNNPDNLYKQEIEYVDDKEGIARFGVREIEVTAMGCTSRGQAHRLGVWTLLTELEVTDTVSFKTGLEGCGVSPGEVIMTSDPLRAGKRMGGRITAATLDTIELDSSVELQPGVNYSVSVILPSGVVESRDVVNTVGVATSVTSITLLTPLPVAPQKYSVWVLSAQNLVPELWRVTGVTEVEPGIVEVTALEHVPGIYAAVEQNLKLEHRPTSNISTVPGVVTNLVAVNDVVKLNSMEYASRVSVSWTAPAGATRFFVSWKRDGENQVTRATTSPSYDIDNIPAGNYQISVTVENSLGIRGPVVTINHVVDMSYVEPDVTGLSLAPNFNGTDCPVKWNRLDWAISYTIQVWAGSTMLREVLTETPAYTYTFNQNVTDGGPRRDLTFKVKANSWRGASKNWASLVATNPAPATPVGITTEVGPGQVSIMAQRPDDQDLEGMLVWMSTSSTVAPLPVNLVYRGKDNAFMKTGLEPGLPVYFRVAFYDTFGESGLNVSSSVSATPTATGGITKVPALPANPAAVNGQTAVFLDVADTNTRGLYGWDGTAWKFTRDGGYLVANSVTADRLNVNQLSAISANLGTMTAGNITLDAAGFIRGGSTGYMTGNGIWMGYHSGFYKLHVGSPTGAGFSWDGTSLVIRGADGRVILASGGGVPVSAVSGIQGAGTNLAYNTSASPTNPNNDGWGLWTNAVAGFDGTEAQHGFVSPGWPFTMPSSSARFLRAVGPAVPLRELEFNIHPQQIPVRGNARVEAQALTGAHRCTAAVCINWYNASGGMTQVTVGTNVSEKPGGTYESDWKLTGGFAVAPADAVWMSLCVKLRDMTDADAYVFFDRALIGLAIEGQTVLSNWSEGARTVTNTNQLVDGAGFGTAAANAKAAADAANSKLAELASDNKLTPVEKQAALTEWNNVSVASDSLNNQATAFGVVAEKDNHINAMNQLASYLGPLLSNMSNTTDIDANVWRSRWSAYYTAKQALLNKITTVAKDAGATFGVNVFGKIDGSNASTFIEDAAIGAAQIGSIALTGVGKFNVRSAAAGQRMEMDSRFIKVYDSFGTLRIKLGDLS